MTHLSSCEVLSSSWGWKTRERLAFRAASGEGVGLALFPRGLHLGAPFPGEERGTAAMILQPSCLGCLMIAGKAVLISLELSLVIDCACSMSQTCHDEAWHHFHACFHHQGLADT